MAFGARLKSQARYPIEEVLSYFGYRSPDSLADLRAPQRSPESIPPEQVTARSASKILGRADLFTKYSGEKYLPGKNGRSALCVAGFSASNYPVSEVGHILNRKLDASVLLSPLAMHRSYPEFRNTKYEAWVERMDEQSARLGNPVGVLYSAASLAGIEVERRHPGRFKGLVLIGSPLKLCSPTYQFLMTACDIIRERTAKNWPEVAKFINEMTFKIPTTFKDVPKLVRKNAIYEDSSGAAFLELYKGQQRAIEGLRQIGCPILYIQGRRDEFVSPAVPRLFQKLYPKKLLTVYEVDGSHGPQLEDERSKIFSLITDWIKKELPH